MKFLNFLLSLFSEPITSSNSTSPSESEFSSEKDTLKSTDYRIMQDYPYDGTRFRIEYMTRYDRRWKDLFSMSPDRELTLEEAKDKIQRLREGDRIWGELQKRRQEADKHPIYV